MGIVSQRLTELRESLGMTKSEFANLLETAPANITRYEKNDMNMSLDAARNIAAKTKVNPGWLLGWDDDKYLPKRDSSSKPVPLLGTIAAGSPILIQENIEGYEYVDASQRIDFALRVKGDSMINARILDGDIIFVRQQPEVENGEIAVVMIDGEEATLKRVYKMDGSIILRAENPNYPDRIFRRKDKQVEILGKAVFFKSEVK